MSTQADRLTKLTSQLVGDVSRLPGVSLDQAGEQQLVQLLTDAFEAVGHIALGSYEVGHYGPEVLVTVKPNGRDAYVTGRPAELEVGMKSCGCGPGQSCHTCLPLPGGITF